MLTVAHLATQFPSAVEPYVGEEIGELRGRGVCVIPCSVRKPRISENAKTAPEVIIARMRSITAWMALWLCIRKMHRIAPLLARVLFRGKESLWQRLKAMAHTFLGACFAVMLKDRAVDHIHVHHGYFGSWIAMTAARLLGVEFSMTLHGSDLLLSRAYLDIKLQSCAFCLTVSEFNRRHIMQNYPGVEPQKLIVSRLGVDASGNKAFPVPQPKSKAEQFTLVAVGRLHAVKNHAFLVRACAHLRALDVPFECFIAGEGPERHRLESLIRTAGLDDRVTLLGHVQREQMDSLYDRADVVVLTSNSEGLPLVLMEAMARGCIVLAPAITGIPELVIRGKTGFLYEPGSMSDFVDRLLFIHSLMRPQTEAMRNPLNRHLQPAAKILDWIRHGAQVQVHHNFNRAKNLEAFAGLFLRQMTPQSASIPDENFILQQI